MNYCSKIWVILFFILFVLSSRLALTQAVTHEQVQASISKTVEKSAPSTSPMVYGPISIKLVNEPVISAIKKVAVAVHLRPVLDYDLIKKDKKVNLNLEVASLPEALDQILQDLEVQYSITESGLLVFTEKQETHAKGSGSLKGSVLDKANGEPLIGANIVIQNTSLGVAADIDGNYQIKLIPVGNWNIKVTCIGYVPIVREVTIKENETAEEMFRLTAQAIVGEEVVVTAQARGQVQAINQQLSSDKIVNIVSEARIQELPDFNAAQAISRLPGVSTLESSGEANKVVIRGLAPKYNQVSIGGVSLASTGSSQIGASSQGYTAGNISNDRSVDLTMLTPYMIKSIEVFKSLTPDLDANAIGGIVNMKLREAPSGLRGDVLWQSGYSAKSDNYGNYRGVVSVSNRFFDDAVGVYVLGNAEKYDRNDDNMNAGYSTGLLNKDASSQYYKVQVTNVSLQRHVETRERFGINAVLDYKFSTGVLRSINMFSRLNSDFKNYNEILDFKGNNIDMRYQSGINSTDVGINTLEFENDFGFMSVELKAAHTYSKNSLPKSPLYVFRQTGGVSTGAIPYDTPPENLINQVVYRSDTSNYLNNINLFSSLYEENDDLIKGDFKIPLALDNKISGFIKFGGEYRKNKHTNDQSTPYGEPTTANSPINRAMTQGIMANYPITVAGNGRFRTSDFTSKDSKLYESFLGDKFGRMFWAADASMLNSITDYIRGVDAYSSLHASSANPGGWFNGLYQNLPNDYDYTENYTAGYLMGQVNFGSNLVVIGGVRYEEITSDYHAYNLLDARDVASQTYQDTTVHPGNHFLLPMVQAKYNIFDWCDIRYSYSQTLARPDYHQLTPHFIMSNDRNNVSAGNPKLRPAQAQNHDFMITFHSNELGLFSIGAFYKEVKDFAYSTSYRLRQYYDPISGAITIIKPGLDSVGTYAVFMSPPNSGATLNTFINNKWLAYIRGFEFDLQTRFWYLPFPLDGLLLGINYTHIWTSTQYPFLDDYTVGRRPNPVYIVQIDSSREGRLINQPNDIANAFVGYDYKGFSAKVSFVFQGNSVSGIGQFPEQDGFTDDYYRVDISVRQMLPWNGLQLFLDVNNINNRQNISKQISIGGFTNQKNYGLVANLGIRYSYSFQ